MKYYKKNKKILEESFNYSAEMEHDACGVGLIAATNGKKSRKIVGGSGGLSQPASQELDPAPREAEVIEGSPQLST